MNTTLFICFNNGLVDVCRVPFNLLEFYMNVYEKSGAFLLFRYPLLVPSRLYFLNYYSMHGDNNVRIWRWINKSILGSYNLNTRSEKYSISVINHIPTDGSNGRVAPNISDQICYCYWLDMYDLAVGYFLKFNPKILHPVWMAK